MHANRGSEHQISTLTSVRSSPCSALGYRGRWQWWDQPDALQRGKQPAHTSALKHSLLQGTTRHTHGTRKQWPAPSAGKHMRIPFNKASVLNVAPSSSLPYTHTVLGYSLFANAHDDQTCRPSGSTTFVCRDPRNWLPSNAQAQAHGGLCEYRLPVAPCEQGQARWLVRDDDVACCIHHVCVCKRGIRSDALAARCPHCTCATLMFCVPSTTQAVVGGCHAHSGPIPLPMSCWSDQRCVPRSRHCCMRPPAGKPPVGRGLGDSTVL
jgi:hypothetical protein